jgi:polyferredoxin
MAAMAQVYKRTNGEKIFLALFFPAVLVFYFIYKYPLWFVSSPEQVVDSFYWFGKSTSFWYSTAYSFYVCSICAHVLYKNKTPYGDDKDRALSSYQRKKWWSILLSQAILFYIVPYIIPGLKNEGGFFNDSYAPLNKDAYVYVYNGFKSMGGFLYVFLIVPVAVWFFGKRYCSWFCACGNLAEVTGVTKWGSQWVKMLTPRGKMATKLEFIQVLFLGFAIVFGVLIFLDSWKIITAPDLITSFRAFQDLTVDFIFGAIIGVGAYPIMGTRIWCRYGCPLAAFMKKFGSWSKSQFKVAANSNCVGINKCTQVCPMGIDVASFAHSEGNPILGSFNLNDTPCIGCGGCVDICPVDALSFEPVSFKGGI